MSDEEWVKVATVDDTAVAELLVMLKQVKQPQPSPPPLPAKPALSLEWSVRQRRSKAVVVQAKNQAPRASPTTPLSWSGATSLSGGCVGGGCGSGGCSVDGGPEEESSRPYPLVRPSKRSGISRSKVIGTSENATNKRSRKKKTLAELKEEEDMLQKERRQLKRELATIRLNLEKERARNENFKRIKLELQAPPVVESGPTVKSDEAILDQHVQKMACVDPVPALLPAIIARNEEEGPVQPSAEVSCCEGNKELTASKFVLPDLNIPFEDNSSTDALCGVC
ncbi:unnamed protein product [Coffea canephora]|uniref:BZIP domain-containing protein n=1 Tax=Coffea canephora TaxID=49390 RepID=A0A068TPR2_COFCA|nr:unnamed protein product [Coffea canephora]